MSRAVQGIGSIAAIRRSEPARSTSAPEQGPKARRDDRHAEQAQTHSIQNSGRQHVLSLKMQQLKHALREALNPGREDHYGGLDLMKTENSRHQGDSKDSAGAHRMGQSPPPTEPGGTLSEVAKVPELAGLGAGEPPAADGREDAKPRDVRQDDSKE